MPTLGFHLKIDSWNPKILNLKGNMAFKLCNSNLIVNTLGQDLWIQEYLKTTISIIIIQNYYHVVIPLLNMNH